MTVFVFFVDVCVYVNCSFLMFVFVHVLEYVLDVLVVCFVRVLFVCD